MSSRCWGVPFGSPGTLCHCGHPIDFHVRQMHIPTGEAFCLACVVAGMDELERAVRSLQEVPPIDVTVALVDSAQLRCYHCDREFKDADVRELHEAVFHEGT